jgi:dipeptidyl aminopeptidase/acylaminoacyl peptidase
MLILHGEEDPQIPLSQAIILYRGLKRLSMFPERHRLAIYPREGHVFSEKGGFEDALSRMKDYFAKYLT